MNQFISLGIGTSRSLDIQKHSGERCDARTMSGQPPEAGDQFEDVPERKMRTWIKLQVLETPHQPESPRWLKFQIPS